MPTHEREFTGATLRRMKALLAPMPHEDQLILLGSCVGLILRAQTTLADRARVMSVLSCGIEAARD